MLPACIDLQNPNHWPLVWSPNLEPLRTLFIYRILGKCPYVWPHRSKEEQGNAPKQPPTLKPLRPHIQTPWAPRPRAGLGSKTEPPPQPPFPWKVPLQPFLGQGFTVQMKPKSMYNNDLLGSCLKFWATCVLKVSNMLAFEGCLEVWGHCLAYF